MTFNQLAKYAIILSFLPSLYFVINPGRIVVSTILCSYPLIFGIIALFKTIKVTKIDGRIFIDLFIFYNLILLVRGVIDAKTYQDWTSLLSTSVSIMLFVPFVVYFGVFTRTMIIVLKAFSSYGLFFLFVLYFLPKDGGPFSFTHAASPIVLFILLIPYVSRNVKLFIVCMALISFFSDFTIRVNLINISVAFFICFIYYLRRGFWTYRLTKVFMFLMFILPTVALFLGVFGIFNVFKIGDFYGAQLELGQGSSGKQELLVDSRTSIYIDVFSQLERDNAFLFGLGASGKTETSLSASKEGNYFSLYKEGRRSTESGMLNMIQWGGILGGLIYGLLFFKASYLGVFKSQNWFCRMMGLWIAFKFMFSFIEDFQFFAPFYISVVFSIGICFNKELREMNDDSFLCLVRENLFLRKVKLGF